MSKFLFWVTVGWERGGEKFALFFTVAAMTVEEAEKCCVDHLKPEGICAKIATKSMRLEDCFCVSDRTKIIYGQAL